MGVNEDIEQTLHVAQLMGTKTALNEFIAYQRLGQMLAQKPPLISPRSAMIATYALCGFSNFSSVGIVLGILGSMAPSQKPVIVRIVLRALLAGSISCFFTATVAGILVDQPLRCVPSDLQADCFNVSQYQMNIIKSLPTSSFALTNNASKVEL